MAVGPGACRGAALDRVDARGAQVALAPGADDPLTKAAAARYLGVGDRTLRRLIEEGRVAPSLRPRDLDAYLAKVRVEPGSLGHLCMWDRYAKEPGTHSASLRRRSG